MGLPEKIVYMFIGPTLFIGGWYFDFGRHKKSVDLLDIMLFLFPAVLLFLYGLSRRACEWGLRVYILCWFVLAAAIVWVNF